MCQNQKGGWKNTRQAGGVWRALETGKLCKLVGKLMFEQASEESKEALASTSLGKGSPAETAVQGKTSRDTFPRQNGEAVWHRHGWCVEIGWRVVEADPVPRSMLLTLRVLLALDEIGE